MVLKNWLVALSASLFLQTVFAETADQTFQKLMEEDWKYQMQEFPEWATYVGYPGQNDRWTVWSANAVGKRQSYYEGMLAKIKEVETGKLAPANKLNYELWRYNYELAVAGNNFPAGFLTFNQLQGVHIDAAQTLRNAPHAKVDDYEDILARLTALPQLIDQTIELLKDGIAQGIMPPRVPLREVEKQISANLETDPNKSPLLESFRDFPKGFPSKDQAELSLRAAKVLKERAVPAFARLKEFFVKEYYPKTRQSVGLSALPNGKNWYAYKVRRETTTAMSPEEIHELGKREVERIHKEMDALIKRSGFKGDFKAFVKFLRTDKRFYFTKAEDLVRAHRDIGKRADAGLVKLFKTLPRLPYGVESMPETIHKSAPTAYYMAGTIEAARPGKFLVNTYDLKSRPKWEMEALALHEAVPGHHLQISIAKELADLPAFRREGDFLGESYYTAYVEGWGLYAESLGEELGFYKDPYSKFGQLAYEMWRALRLVVDTGVHYYGWSRQQTIDYMVEHAGRKEHDLIVEVDRYITWPGQALAYKIGELKIKELRQHAREQLGEHFDLREFHDVVLGQGAVPLQVLDRIVKSWVEERRKGLGAS